MHPPVTSFKARHGGDLTTVFHSDCARGEELTANSLDHRCGIALGRKIERRTPQMRRLNTLNGAVSISIRQRLAQPSRQLWDRKLAPVRFSLSAGFPEHRVDHALEASRPLGGARGGHHIAHHTMGRTAQRTDLRETQTQDLAHRLRRGFLQERFEQTICPLTLPQCLQRQTLGARLLGGDERRKPIFAGELAQQTPFLADAFHELQRCGAGGMGRL